MNNMHYYKRNIGDYHKKAGRLSMLQHGAYTLLIDSCYDREIFPTMDQAIDWTWSSSKEEIEAVEFVLKKFFTVTDGVYTQSRIQDDLSKYHETAKTNKRIAVARETKRKEKSTKRAPIVDEAPPNHKPLTTNHKPLTNKENKRSAFSKPTHDEINKHAFDNKLNLEGFFDYYESNGWKVGKNPMKNWKAAGRNWNKNQSSFRNQQKEPDFDDTSSQWAEDVITGKTNFLIGGLNENNS